MRKLIIIIIFIFNYVHAQWFDKQYLSCIVLIEKYVDSTLIPHGTGFVLWNYQNIEYPIVVTAGHLLNQSELYISVNADSEFISYLKKNHLNKFRFDIKEWELDGEKIRTKVAMTQSPKRTYIKNDSLDVGLFLIDLPSRIITFNDDTINVAEFKSVPMSKIRFRKDVSLGDEFYFIGFPLGLFVDKRLSPIVRSGTVAWMSDESTHFILDAFSFGGNSGSPVFSKIILGRKFGELNWEDAYLSGMVVGHYRDKDDPIINLGLAKCLWIDEIIKLTDYLVDLQISN